LQAKGEESAEAVRRRVAAEMLARHDRTLRRTARRYSMGSEDAEDAFQRALEILLVKAPPGEARELVRWMHTVIKHEALAIRRSRERQLGAPPPSFAGGEETIDWVALIPSASDGPAELLERQEAIARSREALQSLKPAELRALTLLAEGYSYAEISEQTGFSHTKDSFLLAAMTYSRRWGGGRKAAAPEAPPTRQDEAKRGGVGQGREGTDPGKGLGAQPEGNDRPTVAAPRKMRSQRTPAPSTPSTEKVRR
jgi:RNA polymerase sigma factor (sigma-70 family)